ncbi:peptide deformylase [Hydrogenoanaerobacterium saccharovorans]|uniref:Peptide deformylase n=1 Tax=Hydrogenoanaerobacterium saccharovorans TaxID=474960 RepID=A0ABS2GJD2_9FIRM|nr:peptide deformylase [Hydrogenoanaerobacterium saccharovorans]MBM6922585.1 peptide deformylase [Hydrogenoanaerobacterium saccharovorans]HIY80705.1 peptide deformylase [Bacillota bacterium]
MAIREIRKYDDPALYKVCRPVEKFDERLGELLDDMAETMYQANGVGLAAPQVGILRRVVVIDVGDGIIELVNPRILRTAGSETTSEGCLSFPGEYGLVERPTEVEIEAEDRHGKTFRMTGHDLLARAFCHETDHLDGKVFKTIAIEMLDEEDL